MAEDNSQVPELSHHTACTLFFSLKRCGCSVFKKEEESLRASMRRESQQRRVRERAHQSGLSAGYMEGEYEDDEEISIAAIKNRFKPGAQKRKCTHTQSIPRVRNMRQVLECLGRLIDESRRVDFVF